MADMCLVKTVARHDNNCVLRLYDLGGCRVTIGRSRFATHFICNDILARMHASMKFNGNTWTIEDLNTMNGTFVNDVKLIPHVPRDLSIGDEVRFGTQQNSDSLAYRVCDSKDIVTSAKPLVYAIEDTSDSDSDSVIRASTRMQRRKRLILSEDSENSDESCRIKRKAEVDDIWQGDDVFFVNLCSDEDEFNIPHEMAATMSDQPSISSKLCNKNDASDDAGPSGDCKLSLDFGKFSTENEIILISDDNEDLSEVTYVQCIKNEKIAEDHHLDDDGALIFGQVTNSAIELKVKVNPSDVGNDFFPRLPQAFYGKEVVVDDDQKEKLAKEEAAATEVNSKCSLQRNAFRGRSSSPDANKKVLPVDRLKLSSKKMISYGPLLIEAQPIHPGRRQRGIGLHGPSTVVEHEAKPAILEKGVIESDAIAFKDTLFSSGDCRRASTGSDVAPKATSSSNASSTKLCSKGRDNNDNQQLKPRDAEESTAVRHKPPRPRERVTRSDRLAEVMLNSEAAKGKCVQHKAILRPLLPASSNSVCSANKPTSSSESRPSEIRPNSSNNLPIKEEEQLANKPAHPALPQPEMDFTDVAFKVLLDVLNWRTTWFEEQKICRSIPPIVTSKQLVCTKLAYNSPEEYMKAYYPLMLLETWEQVAYEHSRQKMAFYMELVTVTPYFDKGNNQDSIKAMLLHFNIVVPKDVEEFPNEGWLTMLRIPLHQSDNVGKKEGVNLLAYINSSRRMPYAQYRKSGAATHVLERLVDREPTENTLVTITLMTMVKPMNFKKDTVYKMTMIIKFGKFLQLFDSVANVDKTTLGEALVNPKGGLCTIPKTDQSFRILIGGTLAYNTQQREAILRITKACVTKPSVPTVALIYGPPGTGKTAVISGIVAQLLYGNHLVKDDSKPLILLCAPSNCAVDEDVRRLQESKQGPLRPRRGVKIVRLGQMDLVSNHVRAIHVDNLIRQSISSTSGPHQEIEKIKQKVEALRKQALGMKGVNQTTAKLQDDITLLETKLQEVEGALRSYHLNLLTDDKQLTKKRQEILLNADVIATTLDYCNQAGLGMECLKNVHHKQPIICIVDEATQCVEPELLAVLQYGITKLVLVGDEMQLPPTVHSQAASQLGYQQSTFERLYKAFKRAITLDVQYRMHPEICHFPSKHFYNHKLTTAKELLNRMSRTHLLFPYVFFDVVDSHEVVDGQEEQNISNPNEVKLVTRLVEFIVDKHKDLNIGIVTFYSAQKHLLIASINNSVKMKSLGTGGLVEINTVDGFQGREKDVIIVSAVRARGNIGFFESKHRLNVAITRARSALYICGHAGTLNFVSPDWKSMILDAILRRKLVKISSMSTDVALLSTIST